MTNWLCAWSSLVSRLTNTTWPEAPTWSHVVGLSGLASPPSETRCGRPRSHGPPHTKTFLSGMTSPPRLRFSPRSQGQKPDLSAGKTPLFTTQADLVTLVSELAEATVIVSERLRDQRERSHWSKMGSSDHQKDWSSDYWDTWTTKIHKVHNENHNEELRGPHWVTRENQIIIHKTRK